MLDYPPLKKIMAATRFIQDNPFQPNLNNPNPIQISLTALKYPPDWLKQQNCQCCVPIMFVRDSNSQPPACKLAVLPRLCRSLARSRSLCKIMAGIGVGGWGWGDVLREERLGLISWWPFSYSIIMYNGFPRCSKRRETGSISQWQVSYSPLLPTVG